MKLFPRFEVGKSWPVLNVVRLLSSIFGFQTSHMPPRLFLQSLMRNYVIAQLDDFRIQCCVNLRKKVNDVINYHKVIVATPRSFKLKAKHLVFKPLTEVSPLNPRHSCKKQLYYYTMKSMYSYKLAKS